MASVSVWRYLGLNFVLFLGAIQSIPSNLYEAAELDGATRWHQFRYIIAPSIKPAEVIAKIKINIVARFINPPSIVSFFKAHAGYAGRSL